MQTIASLYVRTIAGRVAAFNPGAQLPKALKSLLQAIDGRTQSHSVALQFADLGDVDSLLDQLESAGLIAPKSAAPSAKPVEKAMDDLLASPARREDALEASSDSSLDDIPSRSLEESMLELTQQVADIMATFVLTYLPSQAYGMLKELEGLRSPAQLKATLPSYEALANTAGQAGSEHMADLKQLIAFKFIAA